MQMGDRAALVGRNGAGKSTLLKLITKKLNPTKGRVALTAKARIAYIAQHQVQSQFYFSRQNYTNRHLVNI